MNAAAALVIDGATLWRASLRENNERSLLRPLIEKDVAFYLVVVPCVTRPPCSSCFYLVHMSILRMFPCCSALPTRTTDGRNAGLVHAGLPLVWRFIISSVINWRLAVDPSCSLAGGERVFCCCWPLLFVLFVLFFPRRTLTTPRRASIVPHRRRLVKMPGTMRRSSDCFALARS